MKKSRNTIMTTKGQSRRSQARKLADEMAVLTTQVINAIGWTEMDYATFQEACGYQYLTDEYGAQAPLIDQIPKTRMYWSWWRLHWMKRDREFLDALSVLHAHEREEYYRECHRPGSLPFHPHRAIMEEAYHRMMHEVVKTEVSSEVVTREVGFLSTGGEVC